MRIAPIVLTFAFTARILFAQAPAAKPGSVEGVVTNSATGEPVKKATVTLQSAGVRPGASERSSPTAATDAGGHFHFDNVEPGLYSINADRDGFMTFRSRMATIQMITVAEEQHVQDVTLKLTPLGVVSGHVLDEDGEPIVRAQVTVLRYYYGPNRKQLIAVASAQSNDLGEFQALNVAPGRYYFRVMASLDRNVPPHTRWAHPEEAYPITFYPNASEVAQATGTTVAPGAHVSSIDFHLRKMPAYHIRGTVIGETAQSGAGQVVVAVPDSNFGANISQSSLQPEGSFDVRGVVNGSYEVSYTRFDAGRPPSSSHREVRVSDADVNGVVLEQKPDVNVSGSVTVEGSQPETLDLQIMLGARLGRGPNLGTPGPDGRFMIGVVSPNVQSVQIENVPPGKYVKSIRFGDRQIKNAEIDLSGGSSAALNIVLGSDGGEVDGNVQTASGQPAEATPVTLAPAEEFEGRWDLLKRAVTDASGNFRIKDIAPGEYKVFAWESDIDDRTQSPEFRKPFEDRSAPVTVGPNEKASVQVSVITADDIEKEASKLP
jgi:protocatechuate 3,4-dioxygenase beta subunit